MNPKLMKLMSKKKDLSDMESNAKMSAAQDLSDMAGEEMGNRLDGLKKVSIASDSPKGLELGLDKAKDLIHPMGDVSSEEGLEHEKLESPEEEKMEQDEMPSDEFQGLDIDELNGKLQQIIHQIKKKHSGV